jgi:hypothetical protein
MNNHQVQDTRPTMLTVGALVGNVDQHAVSVFFLSCLFLVPSNCWLSCILKLLLSILDALDHTQCLTYHKAVNRDDSAACSWVDDRTHYEGKPKKGSNERLNHKYFWRFVSARQHFFVRS